MTELIDSVWGLRARLAGIPDVALVPTMGALHEGHLALVDRAKSLAGNVVVSIFVNPLQFGANEDLDRYPRDLKGDLEKLPSDAIVFAPNATELYPLGPVETRVTAGRAGSTFEGASRPGHFDGMLTVVAKLFNIVSPKVAVFGQKDAQQVFLVKRMVSDLNFALEIDVVPTVREADGLAKSSRNRFLNEEQRKDALALSRALNAATLAVSILEENKSAADGEIIRSAAIEVLHAAPGIQLDYFEIVDPQKFEPIPVDYHGPATAIVAAKVGTTRLLDNAPLSIP